MVSKQGPVAPEIRDAAILIVALAVLLLLAKAALLDRHVEYAEEEVL